MWNWVAVWGGVAVECSAHGRQSPGVFLGTRWRGDDQLLADGRMMPNSSMWSNSWRATRRRSGPRRRARADTGSPVVSVMGDIMSDRGLRSVGLNEGGERS